MNSKRHNVAALILLASLALAGCASPATPPAAPAAAARPIATPTVIGVALAESTVTDVGRIVTATMAPATVAPASVAPAATAASYSPSAKLVRITPAGKCRWVVYMYLTGFAPKSVITVNSNYDEVECVTGKQVTGAYWTEPFGTVTDGNGRLMIDYLHEATGSYLYTFTDALGNQASLPFTTEPEAGQAASQPATAPTARPATPTAATATMAPTEPVERAAVVKSATLNLRSGPGQNYPVVGKAAQGDRLYPTARVGNCAWLQVGVLGQQDLVWVAGGPQYVTLNVPCSTLMVQDSIPPTPVPAPTTCPRLSRRRGPRQDCSRGPRPPARACCASRTARTATGS